MSDTLVQNILRGDRRSIARAITSLESGDATSHALRRAIASHRGRAHVIGVTGPPGGGKSTLVSALITGFRRRGQTVAVLAVDPSSPVTGGAVLGDRIRMVDHQCDDGVFIRSLASRGHLGGLAAAAGDVIDLFDAAGFDVVIVETVGAGQSEVEITRFADTRVVACPAGLGDDVQAMKAGVLEIADVLVVTKGDLAEAGRTQSELQSMVRLRRHANAAAAVMTVSAVSGDGIDTLMAWLLERQPRGLRHASRASDPAGALVARCLAADRFGQSLGIELVSAETGSVTLRMQVRPEHVNFNGRCHGGAVFAFGDMALGLACNSHGQMASLVDGQISISTAVEAGEWLLAQASEVSRSRKIGSYQVKITRARDAAHIALLHGTVYRLDRPVEVAQGAGLDGQPPPGLPR